ncbi:hypothetical protein Pst134EA_030543 [Puccinia striiformis f. sp. tritici]|uniref:hypothetical protein n=1 Tax=Puccinia striiformis f. sp. tritici TaxID=168172 RepID=UPI0020078CEA|nr:hypothetical protein Pst134EA_030543 [Puccinia striiformis f. sp. tritici]KAH9446632.1 hypothetical protein Pst134EA_030543 [Puccinia striiformis f. sp. tritici]
MDKSTSSNKPYLRSENKHSGSNILVVPPTLHPSQHIPGTSNASGKNPALFPIHPGGIIIPLQPTLRRQITEIAKHFTFPSTVGISVHANVSIQGAIHSSRTAGNSGGVPLPQISAASWNSLFFGCKEHADIPKCQATWMGPSRPSGLGVSARLEFRIDCDMASWYEPWLMSTFCRKVPRPEVLIVDYGVEASRRRSDTVSSSSSRLSGSTALTSSNISPMQSGTTKVASTPEMLRPSPIPRDGSTRPIRSRSIYLLSQAREYERNHRPESPSPGKYNVSPACRNRRKSQELEHFISPLNSGIQASSSKAHKKKSIHRLDWQCHGTDLARCGEGIPPCDHMSGIDERSSEDSNSRARSIDEPMEMTCERTPEDRSYNHPNLNDNYFQSEINESRKITVRQTAASEETSMGLERTWANLDTCKDLTEAASWTAIERQTSDNNMISDWKRFLSNTSPTSTDADWDKLASVDRRNRQRRVPQSLDLLPVDISDASSPIISPSPNVSPPISPALENHKAEDCPNIELKRTHKTHRNSTVSNPRFLRAFLDSLPPSVTRNVANQTRKPRARVTICESNRFDSVKKRSIYEDDPVQISGPLSENGLITNSDSLYAVDPSCDEYNSSPESLRDDRLPPRTSIVKRSNYPRDAMRQQSGRSLGSPTKAIAPHQETAVRGLLSFNEGNSPSKKSPKMIGLQDDRVKFGAQGPHDGCHSFIPVALNRKSSSPSYQSVIHKAMKVEIVNCNSTSSRFTTLRLPV